MKGIKRSASIEGLLPSEVMLLAMGGGKSSYSSSSLPKQLRRLFMQKRVERTLASYELVGFEEQRARPVRSHRKHKVKLPSDSGGPIIICLDTSYSMEGQREFLAKAVVFECTLLAVREKRPCVIISFSGKGDVQLYDVSLSGKKDWLLKLLGFLAFSFKGGTDVTSPLIKALQMVNGTSEWAMADIVMVTDGELSHPPVSVAVMSILRQMERTKALRVHGLLVGNEQSEALDQLCTDWDDEYRVHDFLCRLDPAVIARKQREGSELGVRHMEEASSGTSLLKGKILTTRRSSALFMASSDFMSDSTETENQIYTAACATAEILIAKGYEDLAAATRVKEQAARNRQTIRLALEKLQLGLVDRGMEARLVLLAAVAREHVLLIGPPGTGKSELGRRLSLVTGDGSFFERLLTRFTTPEELFGPLSLAALERDQYVRNTNGYLPTASVAFLDEVFKANSAILNALLTILNERLFDNGRERVKVPLMAVVGASNELPETEELDALYDRFLLRGIVNPVSDSSVLELLRTGLAPPSTTSETTTTTSESSAEVREVLRSVYDDSLSVSVSSEVFKLLQDLRVFLRDSIDPPVTISDRRLVKALRLLRVVAASHGHNSVSLLDCFVLRHVLWQTPEDIEKIDRWLWRRLSDCGSLEGLSFVVASTHNKVDRQLRDEDADESAVRADLQAELSEVAGVLVQRSAELLLFSEECRGLRSATGEEANHLWLGETDVIAVRQRLYPKVAKALEATKNMLYSTLAMKEAISTAESVAAETSGQRARSNLDLAEVCERWKLATSPRDSDSGDEVDAMTEDDLSLLTKKEAQARLSPEDFKRWKRTQKGKKPRRGVDEDE